MSFLDDVEKEVESMCGGYPRFSSIMGALREIICLAEYSCRKKSNPRGLLVRIAALALKASRDLGYETQVSPKGESQ